MPEATIPATIVPGTYIAVRTEGLIAPAAITTGNIGIVGSASTVPTETKMVSSYQEVQRDYGPYDAYASGAGKQNLTRAAEVLYRNGAGVAYARAVPSASAGDQAAYTAAFTELLKEDVNILVAPELSTAAAYNVLLPIVTNAVDEDRDLIAVIGSDETTVSKIRNQVKVSDRIIHTAPGIRARDAAAPGSEEQKQISLPGTYGAAAVAGLLSTLAPQSSPTNKMLPGVEALSQRFSYAETRSLIEGGVLVLEDRAGIRVVRGVTTQHKENGPYRQITTRRITDYAKEGIRSASNPFIGRLNNERVRKALHGAISSFLNSMLVDEALTSYELAVTASRQDELQGKAVVNAILQPTFSIDFVVVTLVLQ